MEAVYDKLKEMREQAGLQQEQIAAFLGVTQTYISKVETGEQNLTVEQLENLVNLYGYSLPSFNESLNHVQPIRFAFRAQDVSQEDLKVIAEIGRIAVNSRFMADILEGTHD